MRRETWGASLSLLNSNPSDGLLKAAGTAGIGSTAVTEIHNKMKSCTREQDRSRLVEQLRLAQPASADAPAIKRASSELANDLLDKSTAGDLRTAAELVLSAGGAGYGHKEALRGKFTAQANKNSKALPQKTRTVLVQAGLLQLPPRRGSWPSSEAADDRRCARRVRLTATCCSASTRPLCLRRFP